MRVYLDIETIPTQRQEIIAEIEAEERSSAWEEADSVTPPANYKSAEAIAKWWEETGNSKKAAILESIGPKTDERIRKTSLDGALGQIAVIGLAFDDESPIALYADDYARQDAEAQILMSFSRVLIERSDVRDPFQFIGHHIIGFDLRFILQRSIINGIRPYGLIPFDAKPWEKDRVVDTMTAWAGTGNRISLDKLCKALNIPGKSGDIDGSKVWDFVKAGKIADVSEYCKDDVIKTRECHKRIAFL